MQSELLDGLIETMKWLSKQPTVRSHFTMEDWQTQGIDSDIECATFRCIVGWHIWRTNPGGRFVTARMFNHLCHSFTKKLQDEIGPFIAQSICDAMTADRRAMLCRLQRRDKRWTALDTQHPHLTSKSSVGHALDYMLKVKKCLTTQMENADA